jgi:hypothetical protein
MRCIVVWFYRQVCCMFFLAVGVSTEAVVSQILPPVVLKTILEFLWSFLLSENNNHVVSVAIFHLLHFVLIRQSVPRPNIVQWTVYIWCLDHVSSPFFQCINTDFTNLFYIWIENLREKIKYFCSACRRCLKSKFYWRGSTCIRCNPWYFTVVLDVCNVMFILIHSVGSFTKSFIALVTGFSSLALKLFFDSNHPAVLGIWLTESVYTIFSPTQLNFIHIY